MTTYHEALAWSHLTPDPVMFYSPEADLVGVAWKGLLMGHKDAVILATTGYVLLTPAMKHEAFNEFKQIYNCGGFGDVKWNLDNYTAGSHINYLRDKIKHENKQGPFWAFDVLNTNGIAHERKTENI